MGIVIHKIGVFDLQVRLDVCIFYGGRYSSKIEILVLRARSSVIGCVVTLHSGMMEYWSVGPPWCDSGIYWSMWSNIKIQW